MLDRRRLLKSGLVLSGVSIASGCVSPNSLPLIQPNKRETFVLVHGAWHGGWCWDEVRALLEAQGHRVYTPSLTGLGDRSHLLEDREIGLGTHIDDVTNLIKYEELDQFILVGHSYAGMVISGVADLVGNRIKQLVFLDAFVPDDGGSLIDPYAEMPDQVVQEIVAGIPLLEHKTIPLPTLEFLGIPEDHPAAEGLMRRLTHHPVKTLEDRLRYNNDGPATLDKSFIFCSDQKLTDDLSRKLAKVRDNDDWNYYEIPTGHDAMITESVKLTELIASIATVERY